ncbi:MAG: hypothetical protein AAF639_23695 [Chloroflexota bacterium]
MPEKTILTSAQQFPAKPWIIRLQVPDEVFTDRDEHLTYLYEYALKTASGRAMSTVLMGRRRMGKTEIFRRVANRLFFEQDPADPNAVVPVYYTFSDQPKGRLEFSKEYLENFIRYYLAFYARMPALINRTLLEEEILQLLLDHKATHPHPESLDSLHYWYSGLLKDKITIPDQFVLSVPRTISDLNESAIVVFLDEFQNTSLPNNSFHVVGFMKDAVESYTCPHFITGSAMGMLEQEILGRGGLFGRFENEPIKALSGYWGKELVKQCAAHYGTVVPELMMPVVTERCGGNPFYISALVKQSAKSNQPLIDEVAINRMLAVDISSGFIWAELFNQVNSWIQRVNEIGITKWILYLSTLDDPDAKHEREIRVERIQHELKAREGKDISIDQIREILVRLSRGDLLEYGHLGYFFRKTDDPILLEFLKTWGKIYVEGVSASLVNDELMSRYAKMKQQVDEYKGYLAEVFMTQVLFNSQDKQKQPIPGRFFNSDEDIEMDWPINFVQHRHRLRAGKGQEIDMLAAIGLDKWVCQSKWVTTRKVGESVIRELLAQGEAVQISYPNNNIIMWIFAHNGLTDDAEELARAEGILWSDRAQLDGLLQYLDLRTLPDLDSV